MSPAVRTILALLGLTGAGILLASALIFGGLDRLRLRVVEANIDFVLTQLRDSIEANVSLGIPLQDLRVVQDLLERSRIGNSGLLAVEVFSPAGISLFNTDRGSIGEEITSTWREGVRHAGNADRWRVEEFGNLIVGQAIRNDFGEPVGYVAVTVAGPMEQSPIASIMVASGWRLAVVLPLCLIGVGLVVWITLRWRSREIMDVTARLVEQAQPALPEPSANTNLVRLADQVGLAVDTAVKQLDQTTTAVLKLDDDGMKDSLRDAAA
ncbi:MULTISPECIES: hypothetical protein [unclassified Chelatococcus]|uniref:hypothetical protein n=1 Tax=unclassified Chelatococcus TaxID=2638111 RepID=UPI001BCCB11D|nr:MULTISPECIES: hypothetical protein [unclassified Chelatococcus]MBS7700860.1 hypothetical protein [Chelatococcus sp. YT9]MBX3555393.1 hypothetical protein [Chelatococcus sp.]